jgi:5,10-methylenetetrahydromethanopterin reductase
MLWSNQPCGRVVAQARLAEELGLDSVWLLDSQLVGREAFVTMAACAVSTHRLQIGPGVTHTATRHPSVIASGFATLAELAPGRVRLAVGYGDSAIRGVGGKPIKLEEHRQHMQLISRMLAGETVEYGGRQVKLAWADPELTRQIPVYSVPGSGPKTQLLAGELGLGVILYCTESELDGRLARVAEGAARVGKRLEDLYVSWWVHTSISDDWEAIKEHLSSRMSSGLRHRWYLYKQGAISEEELGVAPEIARHFGEEYNFLEHASAMPEHSRVLFEQIPDRVWRGEELAGGGRLIGTAAEAAEILQRGLRREIIREVVAVIPPPTRKQTYEGVVERLARQVLPSAAV